MEFTLQSDKWEGEIRLKYHANGFLESATMPEVIDVKAAQHLSGIFPVHISVLRWFRDNTLVRITEIDQDVSFEQFWQTYNRKEGSKIRAMQYWEGHKNTLNRRPVTLTDRRDIMSILKKYVSRFPGDKKQFQPLASTFLHERMWESELEKAKNSIDLLKLIEERRKK